MFCFLRCEGKQSMCRSSCMDLSKSRRKSVPAFIAGHLVGAAVGLRSKYLKCKCHLLSCKCRLLGLPDLSQAVAFNCSLKSIGAVVLMAHGLNWKGLSCRKPRARSWMSMPWTAVNYVMAGFFSCLFHDVICVVTHRHIGVMKWIFFFFFNYSFWLIWEDTEGMRIY